ncbi:hypothetical protein HDU87_000818 [Geranomyces variabilis]|uniref:Uncharacterized protein n=1 Tax=Geranomyces variabilis TaxID=109894 RepID=A0AAD5TNQ8_9FUNG|nr:hypothetical protein HDU87_000818 [Geranomyces variabilis]
MDELNEVARHVGATEFHGTSSKNALYVASYVDIERGRAPSEFSNVPGFYTTSRIPAAVSRCNEKYCTEPQALVLFGPVEDANLSRFTFDFADAAHIRLWRQLVWTGCNDEEYEFDCEQLFSADIVAGPIGVKAVSKSLSGIVAYEADQNGYLTVDAVAAVNAVRSHVVVCLSDEFVRPAKLSRDRRT